MRRRVLARVAVWKVFGSLHTGTVFPDGTGPRFQVTGDGVFRLTHMGYRERREGEAFRTGCCRPGSTRLGAPGRIWLWHS